jgi:hypothetical protein
MAGAIDLFAGSSPIAGSNLWDVNKNPLNQLNQGIDDVIGKQAGSAGSQTTQALQSLINTIVGKGLDFLTTTGPEALLSDVDQFFTNLLKFLGELDPLSSSFDVAAAAQTFLNTILIPTNLIAPLVEDASNIISGVTGFVPMANLDTALLTAVIGGAQALIDAILETVGIPAGSGTETQVNQYFSDLLNMLANPSLTSGGFDPAAAVATFINDMIHPTKLLAPLNPVTQLIDHWTLPAIPVGAIGQILPNLLANPSFSSAASIANNPNWSWASGVTHLADGTGSATATANGTTKNLLSDPAVPVSANQILNISTWLQWSGVTASGPAFALSVVPYLGSNAAGSTVLQTISNPPAAGAWQQLSGTYTVPASGVDNIRMQLQILPGASAGSTWWDDGAVTKVQLWAESWTAGLTGDLGNLNTAVLARALQTDVIALANNLGLGSFSSISAALSAITARLTNIGAAGLIAPAGIPNITAAMSSDLQSVVDGIVAATGGPASGNPVTAVQTAIENIPHVNVLGLLGAADVGAALQAHVDTGVQAITGGTATGSSLALFHNALAALTSFLGYTTSGVPQANSVAAISQAVSQTLANQAIAKPIKYGIDPTTDGPYDVSNLINNSSTLPCVQATPSNSVMCFVPTPNGGVKQSVRWLGYGLSGLSSFVVTVYKMNTNTGVGTQVYTSGNILSLVAGGGAPVWNALNLPSNKFISAAQQDIYCLEIQVTGSGNYNVAGMLSALPSHPSAIPAALGATRTAGVPPSTFPNPAGGTPVSYNANTPWLGLAGSAGATQYPAVLVPVTASGTFDPTQYGWANYFDVIVAGAGGAGGGATFYSNGGAGGQCGTWYTTTITKAQGGSSLWTFTIGAGGTCAAAGSGTAGGGSQVSIPGYGNLTAAGGAGGAGGGATGAAGAPGTAMPNKSYPDHYGNAHNYSGGAGGANPFDPGGAPGGGGAGGSKSIAATAGGSGGNGIGYVLVYQ